MRGKGLPLSTAFYRRPVMPLGDESVPEGRRWIAAARAGVRTLEEAKRPRGELDGADDGADRFQTASCKLDSWTVGDELAPDDSSRDKYLREIKCGLPWLLRNARTWRYDARSCRS